MKYSLNPVYIWQEFQINCDIYFQHKVSWMNQNPLIFYPWEYFNVPATFFYEIHADRSYTNIATTSDNVSTHLEDIYPNVTKISEAISNFCTATNVTLCFVLSLLNPVEPYLKFVNCYLPLLKHFVCEKFPRQSKIIEDRLRSSCKTCPQLAKAKADVISCVSGEFVSTLARCDGKNDCTDGSDEKNCHCYSNGVLTNDSIFCSQICSIKLNCKCPVLYSNQHLGGCVTYKKYISIHGGQPSRHKHNCFKPDTFECYPGYTECYLQKERCIYNVTKYSKELMYCKNGKHLQNCEYANCTNLWMFKCQNSYCLPYRYMCNGHWDCWNGEDEVICGELTCKNMFKCQVAKICIHLLNVCDSVIDCPFSDDEYLCRVRYCPHQCVCLNYGITCHSASLLTRNHFSTMIDFVFVNVEKSTISIDHFSVFTNAVILACPRNNIFHIFTCDLSLNNLKLFDVGFNRISIIHATNFNCLSHIINLILSYNKIKTLGNYIFNALVSLHLLDLDNNKIAFLCQSAFYGLRSLKLLKVSNNTLLNIDPGVFADVQISVILTDLFHLCCIGEESVVVCTSQPYWPSSCAPLIVTSGLKDVVWTIGVLVTLSNLLACGFKIRAKGKGKLNEYDLHVTRINACDVLAGVYLLSISFKNVTEGESYISVDLCWRKSVSCHVLGYMSLLSLFLSPLFLFTLSISRHKAVKDPLKKSIEKSLHRMLVIFIPILLACMALILVILRLKVEGFEYLSSPLCVLFGKIDSSRVQYITTIVLALYLESALLGIWIIYLKLITLNKTSEVVVSKQMLLERQRNITRNAIIAGASHAICWIPSAVFFLVSIFVDQFPVVWLHVITLVILPINSALNPFTLNISEIKKQIKTIKSRIISFLGEGKTGRQL